MSDLTQSQLKDKLKYCLETGLFHWIESGNNKTSKGSVAGCLSDGYTAIKVNGVTYGAHRLAWLFMYGELPLKDIDHINRDRNDNRIDNLRSVSRSLNCKNKPLQANNTSGIAGVMWRSDAGKWQVRINIDRKRISLGLFTSLLDAVCCRKSSELNHGYHENHGRHID